LSEGAAVTVSFAPEYLRASLKDNSMKNSSAGIQTTMWSRPVPMM